MLIFLATLLLSLQPTPHYVSGNFPRDLYGPIDTRNLTWGHAEADSLPIKFNPPPGYRVEILRLRGDMTFAPKDLDGGSVIGYAWALAGFTTTAKEGSVYCDYCADNCHLYIQNVTRNGAVSHTKFDWDVEMFLEPDNVLILKIADFLNETAYPLHIEATYNIKFVFVKE